MCARNAPCAQSCTSAFPQNSGYDADDLEKEAKFARDHALPWHARGPTDGRSVWKQQHLRPDGTYRNSGGFKKRAGRIYSASGRDVYFSLHNPDGRMYACMLRASRL